MGVSVWTILGIVLLILGLPLASILFLPYSTGPVGLAFMTGAAVGGGVAFLIVAAARRVVDRNGDLSLEDVDPESS